MSLRFGQHDSIAQLLKLFNSQQKTSLTAGSISMTTYTTVARVGDIPDGEGRAYEVDGRMVAVFFTDGQYQAIDDFCPHMGASLAGGAVEDGIVVCPWHAWRFRISDGTWCDNPKIGIDSFEILVEGDEIKVGVSEK